MKITSEGFMETDGKTRIIFPVPIKLLSSTAKVPTHGSEYAAGYDIYADGEYAIGPHMTRMVRTGIALEIPDGYFGAIYPRSGLATKQGLRLANCVGVVDSDYRGEIMVPLYNDSDETRVVLRGDRIAQIIFEPFLFVDFYETNELSGTQRGGGGFGSTGTK